jgi:hypothetical protein
LLFTATLILKTENPISMQNSKLTIEQLVDIGDAIHDSSCSFILVANPQDNETTKITMVNHGNEKTIKKMLSDVMKRSPRIKDLIVDALLQCEMEHINDKITKENLD